MRLGGVGDHGNMSRASVRDDMMSLGGVDDLGHIARAGVRDNVGGSLAASKGAALMQSHGAGD